MEIEVWHLWVTLSLLLWIAEIYVPGFVIGVFATACLVVAPAAAASWSFKAQLLVFALAAAVTGAVIRPFVLRWCHGREAVPTNVHALIGVHGVVLQPVGDASSPGRVKIGGEVWRAVAFPADAPLETGSRVVVVAIEGCTLLVRPVGPETEES